MNKLSLSVLVGVLVLISAVVFVFKLNQPIKKQTTEIQQGHEPSQVVKRFRKQSNLNPEQKGAQAQIDRLEREVWATVDEMDQLIEAQNTARVPKEYQHSPESLKEFEALIAEVEAETGQSFEIDDQPVELDPVTQKEYVELQQKFDDLEQEMQEIVDQL